MTEKNTKARRYTIMAVINPFDATVTYRRSVLNNLFYTDLMTIEREGEYTDPDTNITSQRRQVVVEGVPCRMSRNGSPSISNFTTHKESNASLKIFCNPETDLIPGDFVRLVRNANATSGVREVFYLIGTKPLVYDSHLEMQCDEQQGV